MKILDEIIKTGKLLIERGLVQGTGGNISARDPEGRGFWITPSGMAYDSIRNEDLVLLDFEGRVLEGFRKPSVEKELHRLVLLSRPDAGAVVHTHSVYATAVACTRRPLPPITDLAAVIFGGEVNVADHAPIGTRELAEAAATALGRAPAVLLANHGAVVVGADIARALDVCEILEVTAKIYVLSQVLGGAVILSPELIKKERQDVSVRYGQGSGSQEG